MAYHKLCLATAAVFVYLIATQHSADARSSGQNIASACQSMKPGHNSLVAQTGPSPFTVTFTAESYTLGKPLKVTLKACSPDTIKIKGFLIQARRAKTSSDQEQSLGSFSPIPNTIRTCGEKALIHTDGQVEKTELTFNWTPDSNEGPIQFWVTFVQNYNTVWVAVKSDVLYQQGDSGHFPSEFSPPTETISACPAAVVSRCGTEKTCLSHRCLNGVWEGKCENYIEWVESGDSVIYTLTSRVLQTDSYIAIGWSSDRSMGGDSVTGCASTVDGNIRVFRAVTFQNVPTILRSADGVELQISSIENNLLTCTFKQLKAASTDGKRFDITGKWNIFFAKGAAVFDNGNLASLSYFIRFFTFKQYASSDNIIVSFDPVKPNSLTTNAPITGEVKEPVGCGSSKTCIKNCEGSTCDTIISWREDGLNVIYTINSVVPALPFYAAIGFSNDTTMGEDSLSGCALSEVENINFVVFNALTTGQSPPTLISTEGTQLKVSGWINNVLTCTFSRVIAESSNGNRFDVSKKWNIFFATASATFDSSGLAALGYHNTDKFYTEEKFSSQDTANYNVNSGGAVTTEAPASGAVVKPSGCGVNRGCISKCSGSSCEFVVSWQEVGDFVRYTVSSSMAASTAYIAIGFSFDDKMGMDSVTGCASGSDGAATVFTALNNGKSPDIYIDTDVELESSSVDNNVLSCTILQPKAAASTNAIRPDITQKWTILFAKGAASINNADVSIQYHGANKFATAAFSSSDRPDFGASDLEFPLVKAHGSLMVIAWIFFASIGVVMARYYKPVWKETMFSQAVWFQFHRGSMIMVLLTTIVGFIIIFLEVEDWSGDLIEEDDYLEYHPHMGVIVTGLTFLNPLMAVFRPHPGTEYRPVFNWAHWFVGTAAHILAVITIFFGVRLQKAQTPDYMIYILIVYVVWQVMFELGLEMLQCTGKEQARQEMYEVDNAAGDKSGKQEESAKTLSRKRILLVAHFLVLAVITSVIVAFIIVGEKDLP